LITSGVADVFTAGSNENIVFVLKDDGSHVMYGDVLQTGVISNQYNTLKMSPTIGDLVDLQIGYNYVTFLFDSGTVSVNKVNRNGIGVYSLMPEVTPVGNCVQISGQYSHVGIVYESGVWATYGGGLVCQVSPNLGKLASIACGRNFTVTLDTHGNMEFWGYSSDNALQAPRV
jgi:alpha-tubulin suppressor-like RCC1 family protein